MREPQPLCYTVGSPVVLIALVGLAVATLANLLERGIPMLACCGAGMSRSPALVAAALADHERVPAGRHTDLNTRDLADQLLGWQYREIDREQAYFPAEQSPPVEDPWLPSAHADPSRPGHPRPAPGRGRIVPPWNIMGSGGGG